MARDNNGQLLSGNCPPNKTPFSKELEICEFWKINGTYKTAKYFSKDPSTIRNIFKRHGYLSHKTKYIININICTIYELYIQYECCGFKIKISHQDKDFFESKKWRIQITNKYPYVNERKRNGIYLHRQLIMSALMVDHKNRDTLDNRRENLREATCSNNSANRKANTKSKLNLKGISQFYSKYTVRLRKNGIEYRYSSFKNIDDAKRCYNEHARRLHGEFAFQHEL